MLGPCAAALRGYVGATMDEDLMSEYLRAVRENKLAHTADEGYALATVGAQAIMLCDEEPLIALTGDEAALRARLLRAIAAYALRGAQLCDHHASARISGVA